MKPYLVTLTYRAVIMAASADEAEQSADNISTEIVTDALEPDESDALELTSQAQLAKLAPAWSPTCLVYHNGPDDLRVADVLPESDPPPADTLTLDLFEGVAP